MAAVATASLLGCGSAPVPGTERRLEEPSLPRIAALTDLCALARLRWILVARPREIAAIPFLIPPIGEVAPEQGLSAFAASTGIDLRQVTEAVVAAYAPEAHETTAAAGAQHPPGQATSTGTAALPGAPGSSLASHLSTSDTSLLYLVRHGSDAARIERLFRARIVGAAHRARDRRDVVRVWGEVGTTKQSLVVLGRDVIGVQHGGSATRGPARVAALYAAGAIKRSPAALGVAPLAGLATRLGRAPAIGLAPGPFDGELARGAGGLLAGATGVGVAVRPSAREGIGVTVAVAGDFSPGAEAAARRLVDAWNELATSSFGRLLGLDRPVEPPMPTHGAEAVAIAVELDPMKLARGLRAATSARIDEIMR